MDVWYWAPPPYVGCHKDVFRLLLDVKSGSVTKLLSIVRSDSLKSILLCVSVNLRNFFESNLKLSSMVIPYSD